ncbi:MAG: IS110 family transposase [Nitrosomonas sp.]|nr:IS110 family transposase [Nitrosomonas sp.]
MSKNAKQETNFQLAIIHPHTAAIDVGSMLMMVSYNDKQGNQRLMETDGFTESLEQLVQTLKQEAITHVAMEATGVYWMVLYELLESQGLKVTLVNPQHFKNVDAQKTDVKDSQWLHQLHAHGLLRASHIAPESYRELRSYLHERNIVQKQKSDTLNRIHRLLTKMNIKVQHLISDIEGVSGMCLLRAIAGGESDAEKLLSLINISRLKSSKEDLLKSLKGVYKTPYLAILKNLLKAYDFFKQQMKSYELLIEQVLQQMLPVDEKNKKQKVKSKTSHVRKNQYSINLTQYLHHIVGVDLTKIDGLDEITILEVISVTGLDMNKWSNSDKFTSWLNLSPRPKITGGKLIGYSRRFTKNSATQALRLAAQSMWKNKGALGRLYRRLAAQRGTAKAIKAIARKLAVILYHMIKNKTEFDPARLAIDDQKQQAKKIARLKKEAANLGYKLQEVA